PIFDQRAVTVAAQGVQPGDDVGQVMLDLVMADDLARYRAITPLVAVTDNHDAVTAGALRRLDDEVLVAFNQFAELADILFAIDDAVHFRHVDFRSEEHTSELQSRENLVCRLLLEEKNA